MGPGYDEWYDENYGQDGWREISGSVPIFDDIIINLTVIILNYT